MDKIFAFPHGVEIGYKPSTEHSSASFRLSSESQTTKAAVLFQASSLWSLAFQTALSAPALSRNYTCQLRDLCLQNDISLAAEVHTMFCWTCGSIWIPGTNCTTKSITKHVYPSLKGTGKPIARLKTSSIQGIDIFMPLFANKNNNNNNNDTKKSTSGKKSKHGVAPPVTQPTSALQFTCNICHQITLQEKPIPATSSVTVKRPRNHKKSQLQQTVQPISEESTSLTTTAASEVNHESSMAMKNSPEESNAIPPPQADDCGLESKSENQPSDINPTASTAILAAAEALQAVDNQQPPQPPVQQLSAKERRRQRLFAEQQQQQQQQKLQKQNPQQQQMTKQTQKKNASLLSAMMGSSHNPFL